MVNVLLSIVSFFLLIGVGAFIHRIKLANKNWLEVLGKYTINISFPALIFYSFLIEEPNWKTIGYLTKVNLPILLILNLLCFIILKLTLSDKKLASSWMIALVYGNISFLGIPIITKLFNAPYEAALLSSVHLIYVLSFGLLSSQLLQSKDEFKISSLLKSIITNPLLIAIIAGIIAQIVHLELPNFILNVIKGVKETATPVVLIWLGIFISIEFTSFLNHWKSAILFSIIKLAVIPAILVLILKPFFSGKLLDISLIDYAMPTAIAPFALADKFNFHKPLLAAFIIISTLLSMLSISYLGS